MIQHMKTGLATSVVAYLDVGLSGVAAVYAIVGDNIYLQARICENNKTIFGEMHELIKQIVEKEYRGDRSVVPKLTWVVITAINGVKASAEKLKADQTYYPVTRVALDSKEVPIEVILAFKSSKSPLDVPKW